MKLRAMAFLSALILAVFATSTVSAAAPPGTVTVKSDGCTFTVLIDLTQHYDIVGWKVKPYNPVNWNEAPSLFKGSGATDANGDMQVGPFTAPEGHYNVAVDNEYPPDGSSIVVDFWLSCPVAPITAPATPTPTPTLESPASPASSSAPSEVVLPVVGSASPSSGVEGVTGTPPPAGNVEGVTPPPTDTIALSRTGNDEGWRLVVLALAALIAFAATFDATVRTAATRARQIRRR